MEGVDRGTLNGGQSDFKVQGGKEPRVSIIEGLLRVPVESWDVWPEGANMSGKNPKTFVSEQSAGLHMQLYPVYGPLYPFVDR